ncbi:MAG TPA: GAF domain-containing protein [Patescibacteria group bacterium]|nr:GAF domain-containing protein [Patescibacteria group bacterium]
MPERSTDRDARRLAELTFLEEVARLATSARTWDELMRTIIDRATAAADAEVCSVYLVDRDGSGLTLAATNGLDRDQIGVARLPMGVGITGRAAKTRRPQVSLNVRRDRRFAWLQGLDEPRLTSMCSVPLVWNDAVVGVLNVQTVPRRAFRRADVRFLETLAALLAGIVEKGRLQAEAEAQVDSLRAIDAARASLVTIVTHELRTPLAVVRASLELIGAETAAAGVDRAAGWEAEALRQVDRLDSMVDSILASLRVLREEPPRLEPIDVAAVVDGILESLGAILRRHQLVATFDDRPLLAVGSAELLGRLLEYLLENAAKYAPAAGRIEVFGWREGGRVLLAVTDDGPGIPAEWRERIFEPFVRRDDSPRGAGIGLFAARHLARAMHGELRLEDRLPAGSQFVLELAASHGPGGSSGGA